MSNFVFRRGLGTQVARLEMAARRAPKAQTIRDDVRWQRAAQAAPPRGDRALAALMRQAGLRIGESVGLDLPSTPTRGGRGQS